MVSFLHIRFERSRFPPFFGGEFSFPVSGLVGWYALLSFIRLVPRIVVGMDLLPHDKIPMQSHMENCLLLQNVMILLIWSFILKLV